MMRLNRVTLVLLLALPAAVAQAQTTRPATVAASPSPVGSALPDFSPPAPVAPEVITRDAAGHATMRAHRLPEPLTLDGRLDESVYGAIVGAGGFIQQEPRDGEPATEKTDAWVFFDNENVYVAVRCWDAHPEQWVVNERQRDGDVTQNENVSVIFDTFFDRRNGFFFQTSPLGALRDMTFFDEANNNVSWNTVWDVKSARFDGGWSFEMRIPFKSLRYSGTGPQIWGINFRRIVKWKNEVSYLTRVPPAFAQGGIFRASVAGTLVGLETPGSMNLEVKPYVASSLTTDRAATVPFSNDFSPNAGVDLKYGLTRSLTADVTFNTDFAQVEEDVQQTNLTRFSLFFPEKRDFFLEGQGIFAFGGVQIGNFGGGGGGGGGANDVPILFFSRRIGLSEGQSVPVIGGGRITGKAGPYSIGVLNIQTDDKPAASAMATNFSTVRVKRDFLRRSSIGVIATRRSPMAEGVGSNLAAGVDANLSFFNTVTINSYYARTSTPGLTGDVASYRGRFDYNADRYGLQLERVMVGDAFHPELGFTRRIGFIRNTALARFSPRLRSHRLIRRLYWDASIDSITDDEGEMLENRETQARFRMDFHSSDQWSLDYTRQYEYLPEEFEIATDVTLPVGAYRYGAFRAGYLLGQQRLISGRLTAGWGTFYGGHRTELSFTNPRVNISALFSLEPAITLNWVQLPQGRFATTLVTTRAVVTPTPRTAISSLVQYNSSARTVSSSMRLRWEYVPGSEFFLVYSDGRDTSLPGAPKLANRSVAMKITRLLRF